MLRQRSIVAPCFRVVGRLKGSETGVTLIETLVALALIGIISVAVLSGLATAAKATFIADERATAESLARSQMEYVKALDYVEYIDGATEYSPAPIPNGADYSDYSVTIAVQPVHAIDDGIQKITITVNHDGTAVLTVDNYKVDRYEEE